MSNFELPDLAMDLQIVLSPDPKHAHTKTVYPSSACCLTFERHVHNDVLSKFQTKIAYFKNEVAQKSSEKGKLFFVQRKLCSTPLCLVSVLCLPGLLC